MTPTMVARDGKLVLVTGSPGGRTIINTVFTIVLGVVEYGLNGREAVDLARMHHQWLPDRASLEPGAGTAATMSALKAMGHEVRPTAQPGGRSQHLDRPGRHTVRRPRQADPRREGLGPGWFDSAHGRTVGLSECFARSTITGTITFPAPAGRSSSASADSR